MQIIAQLVVWCVSLAMFKFEYFRALGHVWYMHPLIWSFTTVYYCVELCLQMAFSLHQHNTLAFYIILAC
jgi:hypothetical protein